VNYALVFWLTDILFYKLIFKMREINLLQCQSIESFEMFKKMMDRQNNLIKIVYASLFSLNLLQLVFVVYFYIWIYDIDEDIEKGIAPDTRDFNGLKVIYIVTNVLSFIVNITMMKELFSVMRSYIDIFSHHHGKCKIIASKVALVLVIMVFVVGKLCMYIMQPLVLVKINTNVTGQDYGMLDC
jgi:hypothetical protein